MIYLGVYPYCHECSHFRPDLRHDVNGDKYIHCVHESKCDSIVAYLRKELKTNADN